MSIKGRKFALQAVVLVIIFAIYYAYPSLLYQVMLWQKAFNQQLSGSLSALAEHQQQAGFTLMFASFIYGVFHAVGPGHGKFILTSYLSLEETKIRHAMRISLLSSLAQGIVAVLLVSVIVAIFTLSRHYLNLSLKWAERGSFVLMMLMGLYWLWQGLKSLRNSKTRSQAVKNLKKFTISTLQPVSHNLQKNAVFRSVVKIERHQHGETCGCGHQHLPTSQQMAQLNHWKAEVMVILSIATRPCSGAILVLFLAYTLNLYEWGIASALVMAVGTGITLSLFALLVLFARQKALRIGSWYFSAQGSQRGGLLLKIGLGVVLMLFGLSLLHGSFLEVNTATGLLKR